MNKRAFIDFGEPTTFLAIIFGLAGGVLGYWYSGYLGTGAGIGMRVVTALLAMVISFFVSKFIFER